MKAILEMDILGVDGSPSFSAGEEIEVWQEDIPGEESYRIDWYHDWKPFCTREYIRKLIGDKQLFLLMMSGDVR